MVFCFFSVYQLWKPGPCLEASYELGFFLLPIFSSFRLSGSFLGIDSLAFSETLHGVRGPYVDVRDRARFFLEIRH